nr:hypothetical protein [Leekyejoonella antrihumi]
MIVVPLVGPGKHRLVRLSGEHLVDRAEEVEALDAWRDDDQQFGVCARGSTERMVNTRRHHDRVALYRVQHLVSCQQVDRAGQDVDELGRREVPVRRPRLPREGGLDGC